jgi:hypothetical protein
MEDYLGNSLCNINPNWNYIFTGAEPYTAEFNNSLFDVTDTDTTNIQYSIWDYNNTSIYKAWQTGTTFTDIDSDSYYGRISGMSNGVVFDYKRYFYVNAYMNGQDAAVYASANNDVKFLTNSPNPKQIQRAGNEFLYFILPKDYGYDLKCKSNLYFYDGSEVTGVTNFIIATGGTNAGGCMVMNLSYDKLGLAAYEVSGSTNRKIKRVEVAIWQEKDGDEFQYTEEKVYRFEIDEMPRKFGILFQNALGMYDAFDFIGVVEESVKRDFDNYTVPLDYGDAGNLASGQRNTATYNTKVTKRLTANTGWIDLNHFDWLMEMLKSNNIYSTATSNQNYLNLVEYTYRKSSLDDLYEVEVTFDWTIIENGITV